MKKSKKHLTTAPNLYFLQSKPIVLADEKDYWVIDKPAGFLSQPSNDTNAPDLFNWVRTRFNVSFVGLIHRLDRNVSGLLIIAKNPKAAKRLSIALANHTIQRTYLAIHEGALLEPKEWCHYLLKNPKNNLTTVFTRATPQAKIARLKIKPLVTGAPYSLSQIQLQTGRSHQIRAQASKEGYPLLGDIKYGGPAFWRIGLHAAQVRIGDTLYESPLPEELKNLVTT